MNLFSRLTELADRESKQRPLKDVESELLTTTSFGILHAVSITFSTDFVIFCFVGMNEIFDHSFGQRRTM